MTPGEFIEVFDTVAEAPGGIERLKELVLQLAVRGKLVPQDADDEPASVLFERISADNNLKPERRLSPVNEVDIPWQLPGSWTWVRLSQIATFSMGKTPPTKDASYWSDKDGHHWVSIADMEHFGIVSETKRRVTTKAISEVFGYPSVPSGTILMSFKLTIGKIARLGVDAYHNEAIIALYPVIDEMDAYLFQFMPLFSFGGSSKDRGFNWLCCMKPGRPCWPLGFLVYAFFVIG